MLPFSGFLLVDANGFDLCAGNERFYPGAYELLVQPEELLFGKNMCRFTISGTNFAYRIFL